MDSCPCGGTAPLHGAISGACLFLGSLPTGSYALPKFFASLVHKHLLHGRAVGILAKLFLLPGGHLIFFPNDRLTFLSTLPPVATTALFAVFGGRCGLAYARFAIVLW